MNEEAKKATEDKNDGGKNDLPPENESMRPSPITSGKKC